MWRRTDEIWGLVFNSTFALTSRLGNFLVDMTKLTVRSNSTTYTLYSEEK